MSNRESALDSGRLVSRAGFNPTQAFFAVLRRDIYVTAKDFPIFLAQVVIQPLLLLFVFGRILAEYGLTRPGYAFLLFPGIVRR